MTDLERIELACRRIADRERVKIRDNKLVGPDAVDLSIIKVFETLANELAQPERMIRWEMNDGTRITHCAHGACLDYPCADCGRIAKQRL